MGQINELLNAKKISNVKVLEGIDITLSIKTVYEYKTGSHDKYGPWSFQNLIGTDGESEINVKLKNRPELAKANEGKTLVFKSTWVEKQGKNMGVKIEDDTYTPKDSTEPVTSTIIGITGSAVIEGGEEVTAQPLPTAPTAQPVLQPTPEVPVSTDQAVERISPIDAINYGFNYAYAVLSEKIIQTKMAKLKELGWTSEDIRTTAIHLALEFNKQNKVKF